MEQEGKRPQFGQRYLTDKDRVFEHNAWDDVVWTQEQLDAAQRRVSENALERVDDALQEEYERAAAEHWDKFYGVHNNRFFKDRHWLFVEFPELLPENMPPSSDASSEPPAATFPGCASTFRILEVGCGVGNTIIPILEANRDSRLFVYGCDFSTTAVNVLKEHKEYDPERCLAFVCDVTQEKWDVPFPKGSLDVVLLIFVLSAISPDKMQGVISEAAEYLKPGGCIFFRDYGRFDMAQLRFKRGSCLTDNFYVRGDGTRCYFFAQDELKQMFESCGLREEMNHLDRRLQVNRGKQLQMYRVWVQARYRKPSSCEPS